LGIGQFLLEGIDCANNQQPGSYPNIAIWFRMPVPVLSWFAEHKISEWASNMCSSQYWHFANSCAGIGQKPYQ
jgi:hypothetical protein